MLLKLEYLVFINTNYLVSAWCVIDASHQYTLSSLPPPWMQQPILRLCCIPHHARLKHYIRAMFYCGSSTKRCLEEVQIAPPMQPSPHQQNSLPTWCHVVRTRPISQPHPVLIRYELMVHTMNELMVLFQHWVGSADDDSILLLVDHKNYSWQLQEGHLLVWDQRLDPNLDQDTLGKLTARAIHWYNNIVMVSLWNYTLLMLISEVQNVAGSYGYWQCSN